MIFEEKCECGLTIPMGRGYYNYGIPHRCIGCEKINQKESELTKFAKRGKSE